MLLVSFSTSVRFPIMVRVSAMLSVPAFVDAETLANAPDERCWSASGCLIRALCNTL